MIKIRYADLPAGLHVRAEAEGRSTVIYLLPGLTLAERRAALLRARRSSELGYGPRLPAGGLTAAVVRDRVIGTARNGAKAFRCHPLLLLPPVLLVASATLAYVMLSAVTVRFPQSVPAGTGGVARSAPAAVPPGLGAGPGTAPAPPSSSPAGSPGPGGTKPPSPRPSASPLAGSLPSVPPSGGPSGSPSAGPSGSPGSGPPGSPSPGSPSPSPTASPAKCLYLGPLGLCLKGARR